MSNVSSWLDLGFTLQQNLRRTDAIFAVLPIKRHITSVYPIMVVVYFDYLVKVVSTRILHCKFAIFPFKMSKDHVERCKYPIAHQTFTH